MDIHFCDICSESVPESDLAKGRAVRRKGRVVCVKCEYAMTGEHPPGAEPKAAPGPKKGQAAGTARKSEEKKASPPATVPTPGGAPLPAQAPVSHRPAHHPRSSTGAAVAVALSTVALFLAAGAAVFLFQQIERERQNAADDIADLRRELAQGNRLLDARLDNRMTSLDERFGELSSGDQALESEMEELYGHQRRDMEELRLELVRLSGKLGEIEAKALNVDRHELDLARMNTQVANLREEILRFGERVANPAPMAGLQGESSAQGSLGRPEWWPTVADLESGNASTRWQAVQSLGNTGDSDVAEHLFPMLRDPDIFVRMATARILGDLAVMEGVPPLIDALEDSEASVREAAVVALRSITGVDMRFDPTANEGERAKRIKDWRDWWRKTGEKLSGGDA